MPQVPVLRPEKVRCQLHQPTEPPAYLQQQQNKHLPLPSGRTSEQPLANDQAKDFQPSLRNHARSPLLLKPACCRMVGQSYRCPLSWQSCQRLFGNTILENQGFSVSYFRKICKTPVFSEKLPFPRNKYPLIFSV